MISKVIATELPGQDARPASLLRLKQSAEAFAAVALTELLSPIFDTVDSSAGMFGGGAGEQAFKPMMVAEMAKQIAHSGGFGLTEPIYQQMLRLQERAG